MSSIVNLAIYLCVGMLGGYLGEKTKVPAGILIGALLGVIIIKIIFQKNWDIPRGYGFVVQVMLGVMIGSLFYPAMLRQVRVMAVPLISSTLILVLTGIILAAIFSKLGLLDMTTGYLSTSPGAMSAVCWLAVENQSNIAVVTSFHFFRVVFVILTAPLMLKYFS
jgi:membrane AbrB-like protein